jgi:hypothetical protein
MKILCVAVFSVALATTAHAAPPQLVDLILDQANTMCTSPSGNWGFAVAPASTIGVRFTIPSGQVFVLTDVEWAYTNIQPASPPVLQIGSDFTTHFWTPFLALDADHVTGTTASGHVHLSSGVLITSTNKTSAFCVVTGTAKPARFQAQGVFIPAS